MRLCAARLVVPRNACHTIAACFYLIVSTVAVVTKPRIREPQEVHPVFTFTVMFTFKFSPDVFSSPLSFSPSLALVDPRKKNGCFTGQCAHVLFIHASFSLLLPALSAEQRNPNSYTDCHSIRGGPSTVPGTTAERESSL